MYFRNAAAGIIVYAINDRQSFDEIDEWLTSFTENTEDAAVLLVGNKCDLDDERDISTQEGREKAITVGAAFTEVSAKSGLGIEELFVMVPEAYLEKKGLLQVKPEMKQLAPVVTLVPEQQSKKVRGKDKKCC
jgi:GTPase SAR1 family protein